MNGSAVTGVTIASFTVGPLQENAYLVTAPAGGDASAPAARDAVLVDPGDEADRLAAAVEASGATLRAIWCTHAHIDHVGAIAPLVRRFGVPVALHPADRPIYDRAPEIGRTWGMTIEAPPAPTISLADRDTIAVGTAAFRVLHLPGHSPGHVWFVHGDVALGGDVLFAGSIGRTDLPLADPAAMHRSLQQVAAMPPTLRVLPGHGPATTIAAERAGNPFLQGTIRPIGA